MDPQHLLPTEIWVNIFTFLTPLELCTASLVSSGFNRILQDPSLWANVPLNKQKIRSVGLLPIFGTKFRKFKSMKLFQDCINDDYVKVLEKVLEAKGLREVDLSLADLGSVPGEILSEIAAMVEKIVIEEDSVHSNNISADQLTKIFQKIPNKNGAKAKHIQLKNVSNLSKVPSQILGKYLSLTKSIILRGSFNLTPNQWNDILTDISNNPFRVIQHLDIQNVCGLDQVSPDTVSELLCSIERVKADLSANQWSSLFSSMAYSSSIVLQDLYLCGASIQAVHPTILAKALAKINKLHISANLTSDQWTHFFQEASKSQLVEDLSISGRYTGLQNVPPKELARALSNCRRISLLNVLMAKDQWEEMFKQIFVSRTNILKLDRLHIRDASFQNLNPIVLSHGKEITDVLEKVATKVTNVILQNVEMTTEQWTRFFQEIMSVNPIVLKNLSLKGAFLENVPLDVVVESLCRIEQIQLNGVKMSSDQWTNLFQEIVKNPTKVKYLDLRGSYHSDVPVQMLTVVPEVFLNKISIFQDGTDWPLGWWQERIMDFCSNYLPFVPRIM